MVSSSRGLETFSFDGYPYSCFSVHRMCILRVFNVWISVYGNHVGGKQRARVRFECCENYGLFGGYVKENLIMFSIECLIKCSECQS